MSDGPYKDTGDGVVSLPTSPSGDFDVKALVANLVQTGAGAAVLAEALKARGVRGILI
jgi:hypothetical protein